ncbi:NAD(P)-binding domain-containing protein, partial [bacterium]|nr:NAD(P)-binding domain-containing protein [bacterium]
MRIGFIGLGRVARTLAVSLSRAGHIISPSFDINSSSASSWEAELRFCSAESLEQAVGTAELLFITTSDDAIQRVVQSISSLPSTANLLAV